jgi:hypothetical protein
MRRLALLNEEDIMSFDRCRTCKHVRFCTFPRNCIITECDEFEEMDDAPAFDWNLQDLLKLWTQQEESVDS